MYQLNNKTGIVIIKATGRQVAPAQSFDDPDFLAYKSFVMAGNSVETIDDQEVDTEIIVVDAAAFRIALTRLEIRAVVEGLIASADQDIKDLYEYKTEFHSNNQTLNTFAAANNMSAELQQVFAVAQQVMLQL